MSLKSRLKTLREKLEAELAPGAFDRLKAEAKALRASGSVCSALKAGDAAHDFELKNSLGQTFRLSDWLKEGPVVLCFYRGE